jgi:hypothetical protein
MPALSFISFWTTPIVAAKNAVATPTTATTAIAVGDRAKRIDDLATRKYQQ